MILSGLVVKIESVHQNNASMIEMLTLTIRTKFLYTVTRTTLYTCVWDLPSPPNCEFSFHVYHSCLAIPCS